MRQTKKTFTIIDAIRDKDVFGSLPAFSNLDTWASWLTWLKAVFAIPMTADELAIYQHNTGRTEPPGKSLTEIYTVVGRRGGKSFISSLTAVFIACFSNFKRYLNAGEKAAILVLARDRDQAKIVFNYVSGILHAVPPLEAMIDVERADEIELGNDVIIMVKTPDYRAIRGLTVAAAVLDEVCYWDMEGVSPDREVLTALRPATSTIPGAKLIAISTPYSQSGAMYEAHKDYYGVDNDDVLVWQAPTRQMNPTIDEGLIQRELDRDPDSAQAEWLATFRTDLTAAFSLESLEACTIKGRSELPPSPLIRYQAFVDPSGGKHDAFTVSVGHKEEGKAVVDLVKAWHPPFDPAVVSSEIAEALKAYGISSVKGDNYAGEWPKAEFLKNGIVYERCEKSKSELYLGFIPVTNSGGVELPDDKRLLSELRRLERKRGRAGRDSVDHPPRLHDDLANCVAGVSYLLIHDRDQAKNSRPVFNPSLHISKEKLRIALGNWPLFVALSTEDNIVASVIGQSYNNEIRIFAAFVSDSLSLRRHLLDYESAWLTANGRPLRIIGAYEHDKDLKITSETHRVAFETLGGESWSSVVVPWETRREAMLETLTGSQAFTFKPVVQINPANTVQLSQALNNGRFYEKEKTEKKNYHVVNAFTLLLHRLEIWKETPRNPKPLRIPPTYMAS